MLQMAMQGGHMAMWACSAAMPRKVLLPWQAACAEAGNRSISSSTLLQESQGGHPNVPDPLAYLRLAIQNQKDYASPYHLMAFDTEFADSTKEDRMIEIGVLDYHTRASFRARVPMEGMAAAASGKAAGTSPSVDLGDVDVATAYKGMMAWIDKTAAPGTAPLLVGFNSLVFHWKQLDGLFKGTPGWEGFPPHLLTVDFLSVVRTLKLKDIACMKDYKQETIVWHFLKREVEKPRKALSDARDVADMLSPFLQMLAAQPPHILAQHLGNDKLKLRTVASCV